MFIRDVFTSAPTNSHSMSLNIRVASGKDVEERGRCSIAVFA
jgi:hypothetical protein